MSSNSDACLYAQISTLYILRYPRVVTLSTLYRMSPPPYLISTLSPSPSPCFPAHHSTRTFTPLPQQTHSSNPCCNLSQAEYINRFTFTPLPQQTRLHPPVATSRRPNTSTVCALCRCAGRCLRPSSRTARPRAWSRPMSCGGCHRGTPPTGCQARTSFRWEAEPRTWVRVDGWTSVVSCGNLLTHLRIRSLPLRVPHRISMRMVTEVSCGNLLTHLLAFPCGCRTGYQRTCGNGG